MNYFLDVILCGGVLILHLLSAFVVAMLIQGIVYWTTGFSIYNHLYKIFIRKAKTYGNF